MKQSKNANLASEEEAAILSHANELGEVRSCDCGGINLIMGPLTLHFAPDEAEALAELVSVGVELVSGAEGGEEQSPSEKSKLVH